MKNFTPAELQRHLDEVSTPPLLLDVREPWEYQRARLPGSQLIPMWQIPSALTTLDQTQEIVVICHHGIRSRQVGMFMEQYGFENIINLHGGINAWAREVDPTMPTY